MNDLNKVDIDEIKSNHDCRDLVEADLGPAEEENREHSKWLCPFHAETFGSFTVWSDGYHCFGCGESGDVITWIEQREGVKFREAIEILTDGKIRSYDFDIDYEARRKKREEREKREKREKADKLEQLRSSQRWMKYHEAMPEQGRAIWHDRGIPDFYIDFWRLGYSYSDYWDYSITFPVWGHDWQVNGIKHRLLYPNGKGKYRYDISGLDAWPFICNPDMTSGPLLLLEGEIKSMVTFRELDSDKLQVAGLPAKPNERMLASLKGYDPIWVCLDPDAKIEAHRSADYLDALVFELPRKIDDMINDGILTAKRIMNHLKYARKPTYKWSEDYGKNGK